MLTDSFKPCCYECNDLDFDYSFSTLCVGLVERQDYHIFCKHYHVCKKYIDYEMEQLKESVDTFPVYTKPLSEPGIEFVGGDKTM